MSHATHSTIAELPAEFVFTRRAADVRADDAARLVRIDARGVRIERVVAGVRMTLAVPLSAYRDLVVAVHAPHGHGTLSLRHADRDLDVVLADGTAEAVARSARAWSLALGKGIAVEDAYVAMGRAQPRARGRVRASRRSSFSRRRKSGDPTRAARSFVAEHEIIARD